jgi:hypothetical protein
MSRLPWVLLLSILILLAPLASAETPPKIRIVIGVLGNDAELNNQITSYFTRELREIPDIELVTGFELDYVIVVTAQRMRIKTGDAIGWVMFVMLQMPSKCDDGTGSHERVVKAMYLQQGAQEDLKGECQRIVADIDGAHLPRASRLEK